VEKEIDFTAIYRLKADIMGRKDQEGNYLTVYDPNTNYLLELNPTGGVILAKLNGEKSVSQITEELVSEYEVEEVSIQEDINYFVNRLLELEALEKVTSDSETA
jgi:hypothetical protein